MRTFDVTPCAKPRMTRRDKWQQRPAVLKYRAYKDALRAAARGWVPDPDNLHIIFWMPMPKSWSRKRKAEMHGKPHTVRPDLDNLHKGFLDALLDEDSGVWDHRIQKLWSVQPGIQVMELEGGSR